MKQLNSSQTTGPEAIVMASVRWWTEAKLPAMRERIDRVIADLPSDAFTMRGSEVMTKTVEALGGRYLELDPSLPEECWRDVMAQDGLGHALQTAIDEWSPSEKRASKNREDAAKLLSRQLSQYTGAYLKNSTKFARFDEDIVATRESMKTVRKVIES